MTAAVEYRRTGVSAIPWAAWAMIAGALLMLLLGIPLAPLQAEEPPLWWIAALNAVSHLLLLAGVAGLLRANVAGRSRLAIVGFGLTLLGLAVLTLAEAIWATRDEGAADPFYGTGTFAMMFGLILAGIAVARAGRWGGWRRYTVLATGLFIPLILIPSFALPGYGANYAIAIWGACWLLVGLALRTEPT